MPRSLRTRLLTMAGVAPRVTLLQACSWQNLIVFPYVPRDGRCTVPTLPTQLRLSKGGAVLTAQAVAQCPGALAYTNTATGTRLVAKFLPDVPRGALPVSRAPG